MLTDQWRTTGIKRDYLEALVRKHAHGGIMDMEAFAADVFNHKTGKVHRVHKVTVARDPQP